MSTTTTLQISGMTCGGCVRSVTGVLSRLDGVTSADVSLEAGTAVVQYDEAKVSPAALASAVEDAGFDVAPAA